jgi:hypothetical protein
MKTTINHKFGINEQVVCLYENKLRYGTVYKIDMSITSSGQEGVYYILKDEQGSIFVSPEKITFSSKEEAINSLN